MITCQAKLCLSQGITDGLVRAKVFRLEVGIMKDIKINKYKKISRERKASISTYSVSLLNAPSHCLQC